MPPCFGNFASGDPVSPQRRTSAELAERSAGWFDENEPIEVVAMANEDDNAREGGDEGAEESGGAGNGALSVLKSKEILIPAAVSAVGALAASAGPSLLRKVSSSAEEKGEDEAENLGRRAAEGAKKSISGGGGVVGKAMSKALGGGGGGGGGGGKKTRRLPIQRWTDVAVPVERAYEAWLEFDQYPKFMH